MNWRSGNCNKVARASCVNTWQMTAKMSLLYLTGLFSLLPPPQFFFKRFTSYLCACMCACLSLCYVLKVCTDAPSF